VSLSARLSLETLAGLALAKDRDSNKKQGGFHP
jgi:hypothetical protein